MSIPAFERQIRGFCAQCEDALMDSVLGAARHPTGSVPAAGQSPDTSVAPLPAQRVGNRLRPAPADVKVVLRKRVQQFRDGGRPVQKQVPGQHVAEFSPTQQ
jgi:hypothetical protein